MNKTISTVLLAVFSVLLGAAIGEIVLRLAGPAGLVGLSHQPGIYVKNDLTGYTYAPGSRDRVERNFEIDNPVIINSAGFHDRERNPGGDRDAFRIVAVGDSFTACLHVPVPDTWTQILEKMLPAEGGNPVEIINLGLDGTGTDVQTRILSSYLAAGEADLVLLAFHANDTFDTGMARTFREVYDGYVIAYQNEKQRERVTGYIDRNKPSPLARFLFDHLFLFRAIVTATGRPLLKSNFVHPGSEYFTGHLRTPPADRLTSAFADLAALTAARKVRLAVVPLPAKKGPDVSMNALTENLSREILEKIRILDLRPGLRKLLEEKDLDYREMFWEYDDHLNKTGNDLVAAALAALLEDELNGPRSGRERELSK